MTARPGDEKSGENNFLDRWSRRKAEVRDSEARAQQADRTVDTDEPHGDASGDPPIVEPDGSELTAEDVEKLDATSDFTAFMKAAVPAQVRRMALKKLWALDPAYNVVDGLVEYGEDYSQIHLNVGAIKSAYQVGKGYLSDDEETTAKPESVAPQVAVADDDPSDDGLDRDAGTVREVNIDTVEDQSPDEMAQADIDDNAAQDKSGSGL